MSAQSLQPGSAATNKLMMRDQGEISTAGNLSPSCNWTKTVQCTMGMNMSCEICRIIVPPLYNCTGSRQRRRVMVDLQRPCMGKFAISLAKSWQMTRSMIKQTLPKGSD